VHAYNFNKLLVRDEQRGEELERAIISATGSILRLTGSSESVLELIAKGPPWEFIAL
jgi:hypothetical protein